MKILAQIYETEGNVAEASTLYKQLETSDPIRKNYWRYRIDRTKKDSNCLDSSTDLLSMICVFLCVHHLVACFCQFDFCGLRTFN